MIFVAILAWNTAALLGAEQAPKEDQAAGGSYWEDVAKKQKDQIAAVQQKLGKLIGAFRGGGGNNAAKARTGNGRNPAARPPNPPPPAPPPAEARMSQEELAAFREHTLYFKSGESLECRVLSETTSEITISLPYGTMTFPRSDITRIEKNTVDT